MRSPQPSVRLAVVLAFSLVIVTVGVADASFMVVPKGQMMRYIVGLDGTVPGAGSPVTGGSVVAGDAALGFVVVETTASSELMALLALDERVRYVEQDRGDVLGALWTPNDPRFPEQYGLSKVRAAAAWDVTAGSTSVILAIADSGVDKGHDDLGRLLGGADFTGSGSIADGCGHGTHVTGIAGATTGNGLGMAGVAQVNILPVKVIQSNCIGSFSQIASGIRWAADQGADIISLSLGCRGCTSTAVSDAISYAAKTRGVIVVVAAGNSGCGGCVYFPATLPDVIAVGCTTSTDATCSFSSRGPEVDISAPGLSVLSTERGDKYGMRSGTSMSAPHVAGAAALLLSKSPGLSSAQVRDKLLSTAKDLGVSGRDDATGHGRLDIAAALGASGGGSTPSPTPGPSPTPEPTPRPPPSQPERLFTETFDDGKADGWTLTGLWRVSGACAGAKSAPNSLQFNQASSCTYATGARAMGYAQFRVDLSGTSTPKLAFESAHQVESYQWAIFDRLRVLVSADGGSTWHSLYSRDSRSSSGAWATVDLDLAAYRSSATLVRFEFDTGDGTANGYRGWAIDDVRVDRS